MESGIRIIAYDPSYAADTVAMWRKSKEEAIGQAELHSFEDHVHYLNDVLLLENRIYLAVDTRNNAVAGMLACNETEVNQLYIRKEYQGKGLGTRLLDIAKCNSGGTLTLYTFEVNRKAQLFYEKNGFKVIGRGYENEENLEDIKYQWTVADG